MKYQYNFGFFSQWLEANPQIKKNVVQKALGVKADSGIKKWIDRQRPMPVASLLRFCNSFNVPLSAFIRDADADTYTTTIPLPDINDQLEPDGGYSKVDSNRQRGEHSIYDPLDVEVTPSHIPGNNDTPPVKETEKQDAPIQSPAPAIPLNGLDAQALIALENKHSDERKELLRIIDDLQKQNAALLELINEYRNRPYHIVQQFEPEESQDYGMVAEDLNKS